MLELPPKLSKSLKDVKVDAGETAIFEIELTKGDVRVRWFHDNVEVELSERVQLAIDGKRQRLVVMETTSKDEGSYSCRIGGANEDCSQAKLTVISEFLFNFYLVAMEI